MVLKGPLEALAGVFYGMLLGLITWFLPYENYVSTAITNKFPKQNQQSKSFAEKYRQYTRITSLLSPIGIL